MHRFFLILLYLSIFIPSLAQHPEKVQTISGHIALYSGKEKNSEKLPYANLALLLLPDSSFVAGAISDSQGAFTLKHQLHPNKKYLLKVSYIGCTPFYQKIVKSEKSINLGTLTLKEDVTTLKEVIITATQQPTEQKGDTTIYNAEAYKVPEDSYLEALVRRISGLNYNPKDKSITYKGHPINEITVNGKEFFKGNNRVALENLPANFISRLRVYDKATEEEEVTGIRGQEKNYVLDLQTKKEINGSLMTGLEGGYGNKHKFDTRGQMFLLKENGENLSLVGSFGNRNITSAFRGNRNGNIGGNIAKNFGKDIKLSAHLNYSYSKSGDESTRRNEQYMSEGNQYGISAQHMEGLQHFASSFLNFTWNISKQTMLHITGGMNLNRSQNQASNRSAKFSENPELDLINPFDFFEETDRSIRLNEMKQNNRSYASDNSFHFNASLIHTLSKKGNSLGVNFSSHSSDRKKDDYKISTSTLYRLQDIHGNDSISFQNQYQYQPQRTWRNYIKFYYTHKLSSKDHLQAGYTLNLENEKESQNTYDLSRFKDFSPTSPSLPEDYEKFYLDSLSNRRKSNSIGNQFSLSYSHAGEIWNIHGEITMSPQKRTLKQEEVELKIDTAGNFIQWTSSISIQYRKGNNDLSICYNGSTHEPSLQELMAPTTYHSALYISRSNPNLKAAYRHSINLSFSNYMKGISAYLVCNQELNGITQATLYNPKTGGRETYPVNINGNWGLNGSANYERRLGLFKLTGRGGGYYNHDVGLMNESGGLDMEKSVTRSSSINAYTEVSYLPAWGNIDINGSWDFLQFKNSLNQNNTYNRSYAIGTNLSAQLPLHLLLNSDFTYSIRSGSSVNSGEENEALWNLKLGWKFAKERRAEISLLWADILNQKKSIRRTATSNGFNESYTEQLGSYFMVSLKYKLNRMN